MMRRAAAVLLAGLAALPAAAQTASPDDPVQHIELYREALRALDENRSADAAALLERFLATEPRHAGALLDLAISQCELGEAATAERLFREIETRFAPPPGIRDVIAALRASGCKGQAKRNGASWAATLGRGHDDNVNQGSSIPTFTIGSGANLISYELTPEFRPQADGFSQLGLSWAKPVGRGDTLGFLQLNARRNDHYHVQDATSALAALEHGWAPGAWRVRSTVALGAVVLDKALYQRQQQLQVRVTPPLPLPKGVDVALTGSASHVNYPTRPTYGGTTYEIGGMLGQRTGSYLAQATMSALSDRGVAARPGGNRRGWFGSLQGLRRLRPDWTGEASLTHVSWRSSTMYSPGLIEQVRHQNTTTARLALQWSFRPSWSLVSEWRATRNQENITLFQYNSQSVQLSLRWDHP
jgi:hypothetical protein